MAFVHSPKISTDGLVLYLDAGNEKSYPRSGTVWKNLAQDTHNATLSIDTVYSSDNNGVFTFNGSTSIAPLSPTINLLNSDYTVMAWVKRATTGAIHGIISDLQFSWWGFWIDSSNRLSMQHRRLSDSVVNSITATSPTIGTEWTHVAGTFNQLVGMTLYINGTSVATNSSTVLFTLGSGRGPQFVGEFRNSNAITSNVFNGNIANLLLYNKALTFDEVLQNFNATRGRFGI